MLRAARLVGGPSNRAGALRVARRRFATEPAPAAPKKKRIIRKLVLYTTGATATFYVGSAFASFNSPQYHDLFIENVPLGASFLQYAEDNDWDTLTLEKVIALSQKGFEYAIGLFNAETAGKAIDKTKEAYEKTKESSKKAVESGKDRLQTAAQHLKTNVSKSEEVVAEKTSKAAAIAKHQAIQFSEGVEELVQRAEEALAGKASIKSPSTVEATTSPSQPEVGAPDVVPPHNNAAPEPTVQEVKEVANDKGKDVYDVPLPIGFEPPPGYVKPAPPKKVAPAATPEATPTPQPLPLIAPAVKEFGVTEPVISQLASVIDNLASFVASNPAAAEKARDVLDAAKDDLTQLASRFEAAKEEERQKLEAQLDEQTREYTLKILELEMQSQDKLDSQEDEFRKLFEEEKAKFVAAYREKLNRELQTQSEIINERLKEEVIAQGIELQRRWIREVKIRVEQERGGRLAKLDELATNLKRLERIALDNSAFLDENLRIHAFWAALRALNHVVDAPVRKPFRDELRVVRHIATAREDPVVAAALDTLEASETPDIGIEPLADLTSWFTTSVAPKVASVALVPDQNAGVLSHLASHFLSTFTFKRQGLVPGDDVLSTIARAEYYLNEKDLDSATRELNQLKGTAKVLLTDWLDAARKRLEVLQALEVVQSQATLASLLVAQN